jgi:hypothetical protein
VIRVVVWWCRDGAASQMLVVLGLWQCSCVHEQARSCNSWQLELNQFGISLSAHVYGGLFANAHCFSWLVAGGVCASAAAGSCP